MVSRIYFTANDKIPYRKCNYCDLFIFNKNQNHDKGKCIYCLRSERIEKMAARKIYAHNNDPIRYEEGW